MTDKLNNEIKLDRPLVIFTLATTGLALSLDRVVKLSYLKVMPNGRQTEATLLFNPGMSIPEEASEIHGVRSSMVAESPFFADKAKELWDVFNNCYYSGFNITKFDLPLLRREFVRCGMDFNFQGRDILDTSTIYNYLEPRSLSGAYHKYCRKDLEAEHDQIVEVKAVLDIIKEQVKKYSQDVVFNVPAEGYEEESDLPERKFYWHEGEPYFAFSRFKHLPVSDVAKKNPGFLEWMLLADFSNRVKNTIKLALKRTKAE